MPSPFDKAAVKRPIFDLASHRQSKIVNHWTFPVGRCRMLPRLSGLRALPEAAKRREDPATPDFEKEQTHEAKLEVGLPGGRVLSRLRGRSREENQGRAADGHLGMYLARQLAG
jgi:hypothetical protein